MKSLPSRRSSCVRSKPARPREIEKKKPRKLKLARQSDSTPDTRIARCGLRPTNLPTARADLDPSFRSVKKLARHSEWSPRSEESRRQRGQRKENPLSNRAILAAEIPRFGNPALGMTKFAFADSIFSQTPRRRASRAVAKNLREAISPISSSYLRDTTLLSRPANSL